MIARLSVLILLGISFCSTATAGTYSWGAIAAPSRVAGTNLTGVATVQAADGTNGEVQQFFVPADGVLKKRTLAVGKQTGEDPPSGTPVSGGLRRLGWINDTPAVGPSYHGLDVVEGGAVYFSGKACTDDWKSCRYGVYMKRCKDASCSKYLLPVEAIGFPVSETTSGWTQNVAASPDGWVFLLRVQEDANTGRNRFIEVWARNIREGTAAVSLASKFAGGIALSGNMELVPGGEGQLTIILPDTGRAALYVPAIGWRTLP
jgi:hypothetical protein